MGYVASFREGIDGWVHEIARRSPQDHRRHGNFIAARLATSIATLSLAPLYLATRGAPEVWEGLVFGCAALPLVSALVLSRTGSFLTAQCFSMIGLLAAAVVVSWGMGGISAAGLVWLMLVPVEALFALSAQLVVVALAAALTTLAGIVFATAQGFFPRDGQESLLLNVMFVVPAIVHAAGLALGGMRQLEERRARARVGDARFDTLTTAMGDLVLRADRGGAVLYASHESEALFGLAPREFVGRGLFERILVQDRPSFLKAIANAADAGQTARCELRLRTISTASERGDFAEPVFIWVEMRVRRLANLGASGTDPDGARVLCVLRDVCRQKLHEQELDVARQDAERANAWKDRFIANVSHELRTPLNAIIGFSEILGNEQLLPMDAARRKEYADIIHGSGEHLLSVVNSILDISKIEAGSFELLSEPFELAPLVAACGDMMSLKAGQGGIELVRECPEGLDEVVADKRACKQIIINLLSNALKFTPSGGRVTIGAREEGNSIAIYVADTGVGIDPGDLPYLGNTFFQASGTHARRYEGTGLGLSVVRGLVGLHGGEISIESCPGDGTRVTVFLPRDGNTRKGRDPVARIETIARIGATMRDYQTPTVEQQNEQVKKIA